MPANGVTPYPSGCLPRSSPDGKTTPSATHAQVLGRLRDWDVRMSAILFDREQVDHLDELPRRPGRLNGSKLLWVDIDRRGDEDVAEIAQKFDLDESTTAQLMSSSGRAVFHDFGRYIHVTTYSPCDEDDDDLIALECVVGKNWVITAHDEPVEVLQEFADRVSGSGDTGALDGPAFLATLLEWVLGAYSAAFERLEERLEEFDVQAMRGQGRAEHDIEELIEERRRVGVLRRALSAHRSALTALTHPELEALANDASGERFQSLMRRFEATVQEARDARESIVGSFDVLIARTGYRTNHIMKILTLTSVILLPGALIAGVMGMNFEATIFEWSWLFYVVIATILAIAPLTFAVAKRRDWI
jgi:magnesium transporter